MDDRDRISKLPHEIIISIISRLSLREAIATRILSTRWRYLCTNEYATRLVFPPFNLDDSLEDILIIRRRFSNYINMINQIVDSHKCPRVKELRVHMLCLEGATLEKWLVFALSKHVEILDIHVDSLTTGFQLRNLIMQLPLGLRSLRELSLSAIVMEDSEIELLLSNSPHLESLAIAFPGRLTKVSVVGQPTFMLKHLEICHARDLTLVEICNMTNLVSLKLHCLDPEFVLTLNNVPMLVEYSTSDDPCSTLAKVFSGVAPSIRSQLHTLKIIGSSRHTGWHSMLSAEQWRPEFKSVKHLELQVECVFLIGYRLLRFRSIIETCPSLEELDIEISWPVDTNIGGDHVLDYFSSIPNGEMFPSLKKMKFSGFSGYSGELGFFISILKNANSLEELTLQVCDITEEIRQHATARALQYIQPTLQDSTRFQVLLT